MRRLVWIDSAAAVFIWLVTVIVANTAPRTGKYGADALMWGIGAGAILVVVYLFTRPSLKRNAEAA